MIKDLFKILLALTLVLGLSAKSMFAQTIVQAVIGNQSGPGGFAYGPIYRNTGNAGLLNYSRHAYIYTAAELNIPSGSKIISLEWLKKDTSRIFGSNTFNVWMSNTSSTTFPTNVMWNSLIVGVTPVFSSTNFSILGGANTYIQAPFNDSFTYNGGSLQVLTDWGKLGYATNAINFYTNSSAAKSIGLASTTPITGTTLLQSSTYGNQRPTLRITYVTVPLCSGNPNPGNTVASVSGACAGVSFILSTQNSVQGGQISYQWQRADNLSFTNNLVNLGTNSNQITNQTSNKYYRCIVSCGASSSTTISTPLFLPMSPSYGCYCTSNAISNSDEDIIKFSFGNSSNCSNCSSLAPGPGSVQNLYSNYQSLAPANVQQGGLVPFSIEIGICGSNNDANTSAIFIDYNQNQLFTDPGELVYTSPTATNGAHIEIGSIQIPTTALTGLTGMRVITIEQNAPISSPCVTYSWGETEDYILNISPSSTCAGIPFPGNTQAEIPFSCTPATISYAVCSGKTVNLSLQNILPNTGFTYQWYNNNGLIPGATSILYTSPTLITEQNYYCTVTCLQSGLSASSIPIQITMAPYLQCYCNSGATSVSDEEILVFNFNGVSNASTCYVAATGPGSILKRYSNFTDLGNLTNVELGAVIPFSILVDDCDIPAAPYYSFGTSIWIDFNHNGSFTDAGEQVFIEPSSIQGPRTVVGNITIPCTALEGITRMRVTIAEGIAGAGLSPCLSYGFGETEDYLIQINAKNTWVGYNFGPISTPTNLATSGIPFANLTVSGITQGNNANTSQTSLLITNSDPSNYVGASSQMHAGITARNKNLQVLDTSAYFQIVLTPSAGFQLILDSIQFGSLSKSTGPTNIDIRTSANNFTSSIGNISVSANSTWAYLNPTITRVTSNTPLTLRIYGYVNGGSGSITTGNSPANWIIDDIKLKVRVKCQPICALTIIPSNSSIACNGGTSNLIVNTANANGLILYKLNNGVPQTSNLFPNLLPGIYTITVTEENLCSATITRTITQPNIVTSKTTITACNSYTWLATNQTFTNTGFYTSTGLTSAGCPRFDTLVLTINYSTTTPPLTITACGSYLWNGTIYTNTGNYTYTSLNAGGCVNTASLNLTIIPHQTTNATSCNSYTWAANGLTYTNSGTYSFTLGCQIFTLNLTIIPLTSTTNTITACNTYTWPTNGTTYTSSGNYSFVSGCQTSNLNLTIIPATNSSITLTACGSYFWTLNNTTYTNSG
ncbi:MAG TPA: GEVED domain-containing protein, partial [Chitinophagaceae bacterium]|nr:GEVED domain-containing protein [Chitinophagaceae bacterium]